MQINRKTRIQIRTASAVFVLLLFVMLGLLMWLSNSYHWRFDLSQSGRNSLSPASIAAVEQLSSPVKITAFVSKAGTQRDDIRKRFYAYQQQNPMITLEFVDPDIEPERVRKAGVRRGSEIRIQYKKATETLSLTRLREEHITNTLIRLDHRGQRLIGFLAGHGERRPDKGEKTDVSLWADHLKKSGYKTYVFFLNEHPAIPDNIAVLIIASPRKKLLPREVKQIRRFINNGGNVLWLMEPGGLRGMQTLMEMLDIEFQDGSIIDLNTALVTGSVHQIAISQYGRHPIVRDFRERTRFYYARNIGINPKSDWHPKPLLLTRDSSWVEMGKISKQVNFDRGVDIPGPLNLAVSLSRNRDDKQQRIVVIGDGDFVSNRMLQVDYNLDLAMAIIHWLSHNDAYIRVPAKIGRDQHLDLPSYWPMLLATVFVFLLPIGLIISGIVIWYRRRQR